MREDYPVGGGAINAGTTVALVLVIVFDPPRLEHEHEHEDLTV